MKKETIKLLRELVEGELNNSLDQLNRVLLNNSADIHANAIINGPLRRYHVALNAKEDFEEFLDSVEGED